jgi:hypothetical protein
MFSPHFTKEFGTCGGLFGGAKSNGKLAAQAPFTQSVASVIAVASER